MTSLTDLPEPDMTEATAEAARVLRAARTDPRPHCRFCTYRTGLGMVAAALLHEIDERDGLNPAAVAHLTLTLQVLLARMVTRFPPTPERRGLH